MLVNLQLTTENGSLNIGFGEVAAQKTQEEQLDEVEVTGSAYTECSYCHSQVEKKDLSDHQSYICPERTVECPKCHKSYKASGTCNCDDTMAGEYCPLCNQSLDVCVCDFTVTGKNRKGGGTGGTTPGGTSRGSGSSGTSGKNGSSSSLSSSSSSTVSICASDYTKVRISGIKITFDPGADNVVNRRLVSYLDNILSQAKKRGITSIQISSTTNHTSNRSKSAHSKANGAKALDINYIDGVHVSTSNYKARMLQEIIRNTSGYRENYGPFIINKIHNGKRIEAPWARNIKGGHYDHILISIP